MTRAALLALALALVASASPAVAEPDATARPTDPRVIEANALLGDDAARERAIALYREVLADDPDHDLARMWLARVLSWEGRYDEALAHYDHFLARAEPPPWAALERAQVLSWAGRYDRAEAAFRDLLAADPEGAAALRGLAFVYQWSGREARAVDTFERALAVEDDPEARRALGELRARLGGRARSDARLFRDSDDFGLWSVGVDGSVDLGFRTRILGESRVAWVETQREDPALPTAGEAEDARAASAMLGVEQRLGSGWVARALVGGRRWTEAADDVLLVRGELETTFGERLAAGVRVEHGDFLARSYSLDAVLSDVRDTSVRGWLWAGLAPRLGLYAYSEGSFLDGRRSNRRVAGGASLDFTPWPGRELRLSLSLDALHFDDRSSVYYDPILSLDSALGLAGSLPLAGWLDLEAVLATGYGFSREEQVFLDPVTASRVAEVTDAHGPTARVEGGPVLHLGSWSLSARASYSLSRRATEYTTWSAGLGLGRSF